MGVERGAENAHSAAAAAVGEWARPPTQARLGAGTVDSVAGHWARSLRKQRTLPPHPLPNQKHEGAAEMTPRAGGGSGSRCVCGCGAAKEGKEGYCGADRGEGTCGLERGSPSWQEEREEWRRTQRGGGQRAQRGGGEHSIRTAGSERGRPA
ncbi:hypothetical protein I4F81_009556 [Pyropia yezoensis]|uniref:Uncharacterized protein n=1 Tax=Pyropia yezoensis TaxID=2788 RepID=A0ACC3C9X1_PYRYE|nr:hypothetical protein I4F81_009556 [Neopyropia yezoensis]